MGFPPKGVPPLESTFLPQGRLGKGGSGKGLRGKPLGGKPSVLRAPSVADEQPRRKLTRKRRSEEKRETAQVVALFLCSPLVHFYTIKRS